MLSVTYSAALYGIDAFMVAIECNAYRSLPDFEIVGLPDLSVKESKERILTAAGNSGIRFPDMNVTVNLAPADRKKEGSALDLGILVSLCHASGIIPESVDVRSMCFVGELSFTGDVRRVRGALNMALSAGNKGIKEIFVPRGSLTEASAAAGNGVKIYGVSSVAELVSHMRGESKIAPVTEPSEEYEDDMRLVYGDFSQIKGQSKARRAVEIAAAGEPSEAIRARVEAARELSRERFRLAGREDFALLSNAKMNTDDIRDFCALDEASMRVMESAFRKMNLSARAYDRILRVARTIADIEYVAAGGDVHKPKKGEILGGPIGTAHIMEAVQMRSLDKYFMN